MRNDTNDNKGTREDVQKNKRAGERKRFVNERIYFSSIGKGS